MTLNVITPASFIGKTYLDAVTECDKLGLKHRVTCRDGRFLTLTRDHNPERINFVVYANTVVDAKNG